MMIKKALFLFVFLLCLFCFSTAKAQKQKEEILSYHIYAELNQDSSLLVNETIKVRAQGKDIKRGIYRDFPVRYDGEKTPVSVLSVTRNGREIPYSSQMQNGQKRVYLGDVKQYISPGVYEYKITYRYQNVVRQNKEKAQDVFYHNLIGNEWQFDILDVEAVVRLPLGLKVIEEPKVFFGRHGSKKQVMSFLKLDNQILIQLPEGLKKREALTLRTVFNTGFFKKWEERLFKNKWISAIFSVFMLFILWVVVYYAYFSWQKYGKDGIKRPAFPRYDAPKFKELGALFFLKNRQSVYIDSCELVMPHLAYLSQKGLLKITVDEKGIILEKNKEIKPVTSDEKFFIETAKRKYALEKGEYNPSFTKYLDKYKEYSKTQTETLFKNNTSHFSMFCFLMFVFCFCFFLFLSKSPSLFVESLVLSGFSFALASIILIAFTRHANWISDVLFMSFGTAFISVWCCGFFGGLCEFIGFERDFHDAFKYISDYKVWGFVFLFSCVIAFYKCAIVRVFDKGLSLIEHLEGIEMFLKGTDDLKHQTPEQAEMEKLLPYAILLGLQNQWAERMKTYFNFIPPENDVFSNAVVFSSLSSSLQSSTTKQSSDGDSGGGSGGGGGGGF